MNRTMRARIEQMERVASAGEHTITIIELNDDGTVEVDGVHLSRIESQEYLNKPTGYGDILINDVD